ncbi:DCN1-like protein 5 [Coemansia sp. RSA 2399]|nr:DCN1-like protein 5 [Coemansia sp. RSA 2399]KAJ1906625.1 DCN1-like protein 5 [Coemansia sp. IMI 209127]
MSAEKKLKTWFDKYKDSGVAGDEEMITPEGYQKLCESLGYDMEGIEALVLMWKLGSKNLGTITYQNWESGLKEMDVSTPTALKRAIGSELAGFSRDPRTYKAFYRSTFNFLKSESQRTADVEFVKAVLPVVMRDNRMVSSFIEFLDENGETIKSITRDQWQLLPDLAAFLQGPGDLASYNTDDSWPKLYDDFVVWMRSRS